MDALHDHNFDTSGYIVVKDRYRRVMLDTWTQKIVAKQEPLCPGFEHVLNKHLWNIYDDREDER